MHSINKALIPLAIAAAGAHGAFAAVSAEEAAQLGKTLTPWGAEAAGNADGSIPAYTGGLTTPPPNFDKDKPHWRPDPFANEKPLFRIDAKNFQQYKNRLTPGTIALLEKNPGTFFIDVYKTHRTAAYPQEWLDNSVKNATRCNLINDGEGVDVGNGCGGGMVFPIPKSGLEMLWNKEATYRGPAFSTLDLTGRYVKPSGEVVLTSGPSTKLAAYPLGDPAANSRDISYAYRIEWRAPTRLNGSASILIDKTADLERRAWNYQPSTRRVRLAPDYAADTPISSAGGAIVYDDDVLFTGKRDRYDWKLLGKKEIYLPYNTYRISYPEANGGCSDNALLTPNHPKSECVRWELHRVWVVEATLKDNKRHVYHKRVLFLDEDIPSNGMADNYDQAGDLWRINWNAPIPAYEAKVPGLGEQFSMDLLTGIYFNITALKGTRIEPEFDRSVLNSANLQSHILR